jgi:luciferase family oxidoreductase group 1
MLPHYSPLKVAENFAMLSGLYPGRIDLGVGRAPGTTAAVAFALQRDRRHALPDDFLEQLTELLGYFDREKSGVQSFRQLREFRFERPGFALLGSSAQSAIWAAELGIPYVFADFINPEGAPFADYYRDHFQPSELLAEPRVSVAAWALCADTDEEALRLSSSARMMLLNLFRGRPIAVPPVEKALAFLEQEGAPLGTLPAGRRMITGSPQSVRSALEAVAVEYGADEVFVVNIAHQHAARLRSYELIAQAFDLL